ncbi:MAG: signal peptidase II [Candidatus Midichloria sp.]|nr:MAG: signal peptidase II [Candidatus Midichloria sp.]
MKKILQKAETRKFLFFIALILFLDQVSKYAIYNYFSLHEEIIKVFPFLNLVLVWNYGISFGILNDIEQGQIILSTLAVFIIILLIFWYQKTKNSQLVLPLSLIISGAVGNIIDRTNYGAVLDFIDLHVFGWCYPTFNIADSAIVIGTFMCLFIKKV